VIESARIAAGKPQKASHFRTPSAVADTACDSTDQCSRPARWRQQRRAMLIVQILTGRFQLFPWCLARRRSAGTGLKWPFETVSNL